MNERYKMSAVFLSELPRRLGGIPLLYYCGYRNFGDVLGRDLARAISPRPVYRPVSQRGKHVLFLGSLLNPRSGNAVVAGAGFINGEITVEVDAAYFVRGPHSLRQLRARHAPQQGVILGDALQVIGHPPVFERMTARYGRTSMPPGWVPQGDLVVLHHTTYVKVAPTNSHWYWQGGLLVASTLAPVAILFNAIVRARAIASDALHPLILADTVGVPNSRVVISGLTGLIGGDFKFEDYAAQNPTMPVQRFMVRAERLEEDCSVALGGARIRPYPGSYAELHARAEAAFINFGRPNNGL